MTFTDPAQHISTERLGLEPLRTFHAAGMVQVLADPALYHFTGGEPPTLDDLSRRYTLLYAGSPDENEQWHNWIVRIRDTNEAIGSVQATVEASGAEIAWLIGTPWQGRGYAGEAATAMAGWLTSNGVSTLKAWIHPDHVASHKVAQSVGLAVTAEVDEDGEELWRS